MTWMKKVRLFEEFEGHSGLIISRVSVRIIVVVHIRPSVPRVLFRMYCSHL